MKRAHLLTTVLAAVLSNAAALPAQDDKAELTRMFQRLDQDGDGIVVRKEFPGSDEQFAAMDADKNGKATLAEYLQSEVAKAFVRARNREAKEPRPRTSLGDVAPARLDALARTDRNRDGKVLADEWNGTPQAFAQLDLDHDGAIDRRDRALAAAQAPPQQPELPELKGDLPTTAATLQRFDEDGDQQLSRKEASANRFLDAAFAFADKDRDGKLSKEELDQLARAIEQRRADQQRPNARPVPYAIPFDTWDKDGDGKVRQNEWQGPRDVFDRVDLDRDSAVTRDEVDRYIRRTVGVDFVERFDQNGDGKVTPAEFGGPLSAFRRADRNGDGAITKADR